MSTHVINGQIDRSQCLPGDAQDPGTWCPGTMSYKTLTTLLRNQLHFQGVIVSDDIFMRALTDNYSLETILEKSLNAGIDMFIVNNHNHDYTSEIVINIAKLVKEGKIPESRIQDAYQHVADIKKRITDSQ
jgi:beta-N-acetylhexosaminidase